MTQRKAAPDTPCRQITRAAFELRSMAETRNADGSTDLTVEGYASMFGVDYEVLGGPGNGYGWFEQVAAGAADETLADDPDVVYLFDHAGMALARTKSGTLELEADKKGLATRARMDLANPQVVALRSGIERGDIDEMSFGFRVTEQTWTAHDDFPDDEMSHRSISKLNLHRGDVSAVTFGASPTTEIDIVRSLRGASQALLLEASAVIAQRLEVKHSGGMPEEEDERADGMSAETLALLRPPPNPFLLEYQR